MTGKTDFTAFYEAIDPRDFYLGLAPLEYQAPAHAVPVFRRLADVIGATRERPTILDICCSFGVNAAMLNHDVTLDDLREYYASPGRGGLSRSEFVAADRLFFASRRRPDALKVIGLDVARRAVEYALDAGLLADGVVADLEVPNPPDALTRRLARVDLVVVTGGASYVTEKTFETIIASAGRDLPWIAALTLRWIGFARIAEALARHGLVTERLEGYLVRQRRFSDEEERKHVFAALRERGMTPTPLEESGWHCAELFVARPVDLACDLPLSEMLGDMAVANGSKV